MPCFPRLAFSAASAVRLAAVVLIALGAAVKVFAAESLTESQRRSGWSSIFDGESFDGWREYGGTTPGPGWSAVDGVLAFAGKNGGDLITRTKYDAFELMLEYRLEKGANSGVLFHVDETDAPPWHSGPEIQLYDDQGREGAQKSGWLYGLYQPRVPRWSDQTAAPTDSTRPPGQWNQLYLRVSPEQSEVCINGLRYYRFTKGSKDWDKRVARSKFANIDRFGQTDRGHLCLQAHGGRVAFREIKLRPLQPGGEVPQPIDGQLDLAIEPAFPLLKWDGWEPIDDAGKIRALRLMELTTPGDGTGRLFAAAQSGAIYVFENRPDVRDSSLFLDLTERVAQWSASGQNEQGLLGLAFHPQFGTNGRFYVSYVTADAKRSVVSQFRVDADSPDRADASSEKILLEIDQPYKNHNGGSIEFGPDGLLYIGLGDGGDRNDPLGAGQDLSSLLGSVLRIDVDRSSGDLAYAIPEDNPYTSAADRAAGRRGEIYAHGVRNIWRLAFDPKTGTLWAGDVGQELGEEVNIIRKGGNYGWSVREGNAAFGNQEPEIVGPLVDPVWEYDHRVGRSITGGRVYRGDRLPMLGGRYLYADYVTGKVWALEYDPASGEVTRNDEIVGGGTPVLAFGQDDTGEVYFTTANMKGECIYRFTAKPPAVAAVVRSDGRRIAREVTQE